jgi:hypothetical protein
MGITKSLVTLHKLPPSHHLWKYDNPLAHIWIYAINYGFNLPPQLNYGLNLPPQLTSNEEHYILSFNAWAKKIINFNNEILDENPQRH